MVLRTARNRFVERSPRWVGILFVLAILALPQLSAAAVEIRQVVLQLTIAEKVPHPLVRSRMVATAQAVADRLLVGQTVDAVVAETPVLARTLSTVLDRVLTGYAVAGATIRPGVETQVFLQIRPEGPTISETRVDANLGTVHPMVRPLVIQQIERLVTPEVVALLRNLSLAALDWSRPLVEERMKEVVEGNLPGFTTTMRLAPGETAEVVLVVSPRDSRIIRDIGVRFRSSSIPLLVLDQHGPQVISMAEPLRGLPVAFAQANRQTLEGLIARQLRDYPPVKDFQIEVRPLLQVGETTYVTVIADSLLYRGRVEAHVNIGTQAPPAQIVAQVGRVVTPGVEVFLGGVLTPSPLSLRWDVGVRYDLSERVMVGARMQIPDRDFWIWVSHQLTPEVGLRSSLDIGGREVEGAIVYRVNEFLSGELVATTSRGWWIRLVSNL